VGTSEVIKVTIANPSAAGNLSPPDAAEAHRRQRLQDGHECRDAALNYRRRGWSALADCPPDHMGVGPAHGKRCKSPWGPWKIFQTRLPTEAELLAKWRDNPTLNVGMVYGQVSGLVGIDVDGAGGEDTLVQLSGGDLPPTLEFRTPGGGRRLLYAIPPGIRLKTTPHKVDGSHQEVRFQAEGAQTVMPPSRHNDGGRYEWVAGRGPDEIEAAPAPQWLIDQLSDRTAERPKSSSRPSDGTSSPDRELALSALAGMNPARATEYDDWLKVGMALHSVADDDAMLAAWDEWSQQCHEKYAEGVCADKWATFNKEGGITLGSLIHWAKGNGWTDPRTTTGKYVDLGDLRLTLTDAHRTAGGKIVATVQVARAGAVIDTLSISSAPTARAAAAKTLAGRLAVRDRDLADQAVGQLLTLAATLAATPPPAPDGPTIAEVVEKVVTEDLQPVYRTPGGFFCERRGEVRRQDFINYTPSHMIAAAALAAGAPIKRGALFKAVKTELDIYAADLSRKLPEAADATLDKASAAGKAFKHALEAMLLATQQWVQCYDVHARRTSLICRAAEQIEEARQTAPPGRWSRVIEACSLWWRIVVTDGGEVLPPLLAMRWDLTAQLRMPLPGVTDQDSLTMLGVRYGVIDPDPPIYAKIMEGRVRLAVLTEDFIGPLLAVAGEFDDDPNTDAK
jgi:hypothetical protein